MKKYYLLSLLLLAGCASDPPVPLTSYSGYLPPVVNYALSLQGAPYRYGSANPQQGFDCSGFVYYVYQQQGIQLPRTTEAMAAYLAPVQDNLRSGDLVFFNTTGAGYSHVGLYVSGDKFIHAPSTRTGRVLVSSLRNNYWQDRFIGARRP